MAEDSPFPESCGVHPSQGPGSMQREPDRHTHRQLGPGPSSVRSGRLAPSDLGVVVAVVNFAATYFVFQETYNCRIHSRYDTSHTEKTNFISASKF